MNVAEGVSGCWMQFRRAGKPENRKAGLLAFWLSGFCVLFLGVTVRDAYAAERADLAPAFWESRYCLIEGIHYLINEENRDAAEELFRKAIFSSSFSDLSRRGNAGETSVSRDRWIVAEAFYFLGKIHYEKAILDTGGEKRQSNMENIAWAKEYLKRAEEYGIVYDRLHPPLLDEINRKYPDAGGLPASPEGDKAKVVVEVGDGLYGIDAIKISRGMDIVEGRFRTGEIKDLECGARYKVEPDIQGGHRAIYRALVVLGTGIMIWLTRN